MPSRPLRILMTLSHASYIRDFWASGLVDMLLARGHRLSLLVPEEYVERMQAELSTRADRVASLDPYRGGGFRRWMRQRFRTASLVQRSHLSTYRHKLAMRSSTDRDPASSTLATLRQLLFVRMRAVENTVFGVMGCITDLEALARRVENVLPIQRKAAKFLAESRPDVLVYPTALHDTANIELPKAARHAGIPQIAFPSSWDTLTSKGFLLEPADALMVWGEEPRGHAIAYHGYRPERVVATGPAHFDIYGPAAAVESREVFLGHRGIPAESRVILFAGTTVTYWSDEPLQLRALSRLIADGELKDCVVWYRPHPRRAARDVTELAGLPGVYVDDQMTRHKTRGRGGYSIEPDELLHYRRVVEASEVVVTAFSTMIIEAALMGRPSLVVAFGLRDDSAFRVLQHAEYEHMRAVLSTPGVILCRSMEELIDGVRHALAGELAGLAPTLKTRADHIARNLDGRARERMIDMIERIGHGDGDG